MKPQTSSVSSEEEYCHQLYQKQPKGLREEEQWNDQYQAKIKPSF